MASHRQAIGSRALGALALLLLLAAATGCPRRAPPPDLAAEPEALLSEVLRAQGRVERVRGQARVKVESPSGGGSITELVVAERPDRIRLEALDFFGNPAAVLVAEDGRFALLDLRQGVFYRGAATPANLSRLVPLPMTAEELVLLLCGSAPILRGRAATVEPGDGVLRLGVEAADRVQRLDVGAGAAVHASSVSGRGGLPAPPDAYDVRFDRFSDREGAPFPGRIRLDAPARELRVELSWKEIEVNAVLPRGSFTLAPPTGAKVVDLDGRP